MTPLYLQLGSSSYGSKTHSHKLCSYTISNRQSFADYWKYTSQNKDQELEQEIETSCYQNLQQSLSHEPKYLKVAHINVHGLLTQTKLLEVKILLSETKFDMLGMTGTKLSS